MLPLCLCRPADWEQQLRQYVSNHPETVVVDRIDKIRQLHNRATMLRPLQGDGIVLQQPVGSPTTRSTCGALPHPGGCINSSGSSSGGQVMLVQAPLQVEIAEGTTEAEAQAALAAAGLAPPLLCKPLWTDGRDGSHKLAVLHDLEALGRLLRGSVCNEFKPPLVVQQFVEHGGVLFKVGLGGRLGGCLGCFKRVSCVMRHVLFVQPSRRSSKNCLTRPQAGGVIVWDWGRQQAAAGLPSRFLHILWAP